MSGRQLVTPRENRVVREAQDPTISDTPAGDAMDSAIVIIDVRHAPTMVQGSLPAPVADNDRPASLLQADGNFSIKPNDDVGNGLGAGFLVSILFDMQEMLLNNKANESDLAQMKALRDYVGDPHQFFNYFRDRAGTLAEKTRYVGYFVGGPSGRSADPNA